MHTYQVLLKSATETISTAVDRLNDLDAIQHVYKKLGDLFPEAIIRRQLTADSCGPVIYIAHLHYEKER